MRARVPSLILVLSLAPPALAQGGAGWRAGEPGRSVAIVHDGRAAPAGAGAPRLSYADADAPEMAEGGCRACSPKLAYALIDVTEDVPQPAAVAASTPAPLASLNPGGLGQDVDAVQLPAAVQSEEPAAQLLAGLVAVAPPAAPVPPPGVAPAPAPAPLPARGFSPVPARAPAPGPKPRICPLRLTCA